ncbi:MAG: hypothetical protein CVU43_08120 [Chloroflexi bacterium HGW-Chloroflexi-5]|jgi:uncharacterized membrane protein|nr:MAG: hypothetical protein CVU43_08120 [Chloroflexi bacterium HGW-Chloroflexi-5]
MNTKKRFFYNYRAMIIITLICGFMSIIMQLFAGFELPGFMLAVVGIGSFWGNSKGIASSEPQLPEKSFKTAFEWLLLIMMAAMAFLMISNGYRVLPKANDFLSTHWPGLMLSVMCIVLAISGLRKTNPAQSA